MSEDADEAKSRELSAKLGFPVTYRNGWIVLASRGGPPVTNELVQRLLDQADWEDAGLESRHDAKQQA